MTAAVAPPCNSLIAVPAAQDRLVFPASFGTRFLLVVDTEEAFDWAASFVQGSRPFSPGQCAAMRRGQAFFAAAGVAPVYACDYSALDDPMAGEMLTQWEADGEAGLGAHLHPWSNPPYVEDISTFNSFAGNLPVAVERAKLTALRDRFVARTGRAPRFFRAGRYGVGPNTGALLSELGFRIDSSVRSGFDYSGRDGPDFSAMPVTPYRTGPDGRLIELPLSTAFVGGLRGFGRGLVPVLERGRLGAGVLARSRLLQRIPLTPEGVRPDEAKLAIDRLLEEGLHLLLFSFHSTTLEPGNTPYVRDAAALEDFYRWWDIVLGHLAHRGVAPAGLDTVLALCAGQAEGKEDGKSLAKHP